VEARPIKLVFGDNKASTVRPYIYRAEKDGVSVFLAVGFTRPIISKEQADAELEETQYSTIDAGWTIICNDRAVVYCDKTALTGWGTAGIPRYHTQFIAISGIVEFTSKNPKDLPTTTSKRGIDTSSELFIHVKDKMQEGMKIFTSFTNQWKGNATAAKAFISKQSTLDVPVLRQKLKEVKFTKVQGGLKGEKSTPKLPKPPKEKDDMKKITFSRRETEVSEVSEYLFRDPDKKASRVGEKCFELLLNEARGE
jgi:hypothetical protein